MKQNPYRRVFPGLRAIWRVRPLFEGAELTLYLVEEALLAEPERALVGFGQLYQMDAHSPVWESTLMVAEKGFGLLLYELAATIVRGTVRPSSIRSAAAKDFWAKQHKNRIEPLSPAAFAAKYGATPQQIYLDPQALDPDTLSRLYACGETSVVHARRFESATGRRIQLPREMGLAPVPTVNPLQRPFPSLVWTVECHGTPTSRVQVVLLDLAWFPDPKALVGYGLALGYHNTGSAVWEMDLACAAEGFGPLVYDLCAAGAQATLHPSGSLSQAAWKFWDRQPNRCVPCLTDAQFKLKYGCAPGDRQVDPSRLDPGGYSELVRLGHLLPFLAEQEERQTGSRLRLPREK